MASDRGPGKAARSFLAARGELEACWVQVSHLWINRKLPKNFILKPLGGLIELLTSLWEQVGREPIWDHLGGGPG